MRAPTVLNLLFICLIATACNHSGGSGGGAPKDPDGRNVADSNPDEDNSSDADLPDGSVYPTPAPIPDPTALKIKSMQELLKAVAPSNFKAENVEGSNLYDSLSDILALVYDYQKNQVYDKFRSPGKIVDTSDKTIPTLKDGAQCNAIHTNIESIAIGLSDGIYLQTIADNIRYGISESQRDLNADGSAISLTKIANLEPYATFAFRRAFTTNRDNDSPQTKDSEDYYVGQSGDDIVWAVSSYDGLAEANKFSYNDRVSNCAFSFNTKSQILKKSCERSSWISYKPYPVSSSVTQNFTPDAYSISYTEFDPSNRFWVTNMQQTGPLSMTFEQDYRNYIISSEAGWFGAFFAPYAYAKGDLILGKNSEGVIDQCTVNKVTIKSKNQK